MQEFDDLSENEGLDLRQTLNRIPSTADAPEVIEAYKENSVVINFKSYSLGQLELSEEEMATVESINERYLFVFHHPDSTNHTEDFAELIRIRKRQYEAVRKKYEFGSLIELSKIARKTNASYEISPIFNQNGVSKVNLCHIENKRNRKSNPKVARSIEINKLSERVFFDETSGDVAVISLYSD